MYLSEVKTSIRVKPVIKVTAIEHVEITNGKGGFSSR